MPSTEKLHGSIEEYKLWSVGFNALKLKFLYLNIRSLRNKLDELEAVVNEVENVDIICLTETWLSNCEADYFNLNNYNVYHAMKTTGDGRGVAIYVRADWSCDKMHSIENYNC